MFTAHMTNLTEGMHTFTIEGNFKGSTQTKTFTMATTWNSTYIAQDVIFSFSTEDGSASDGDEPQETDEPTDEEATITLLLKQIKQLKAQIAAILGELPSGQANVPPSSLFFGKQGQSVTDLQAILTTMPDIYPEGLITGYFGPLTQNAIQRFQLKYNVLQTPQDQGYGVYGPRTSQRLGEVVAN